MMVVPTIAIPCYARTTQSFVSSHLCPLRVSPLTVPRTPIYPENRHDLSVISSQTTRSIHRRSPLASELRRYTAKFQLVSEKRDHSRRTWGGRANNPSGTALAVISTSLPGTVELQHQALALPWLTLLLHLPWVRRPLEYAASMAGVVSTMGKLIWARQGPTFFQDLVRSEACLSGAILVIAPVLLRLWAKMEARYHDTLECRTVLQTYLIAAGGCLCAILAAVADNPIFAALMQVVWRGIAARSLWTWTDLGRSLRDTPGWLHASVARWRVAATYVAVVGAALRILALVVGMGSLQAVAIALSSPAVDLLPSWLVRASSIPDEQFHLNASQLALGVGLYAWIAYYLCMFLPYRVLYDEYQDYSRRLAQFWRDLQNGQEHNVILSTKLGPGFPKHLTKRLARMPPGDDRELLRLAGVIRQKSCSQTVVKAAMLKKNKNGKYGVKMTPIEPNDLRFWGSDLFKRLEQQERRDKKTGWTPPVVPGRGRFKHIRATYARILREIKVELGKTDEEMENDPLLSLSNLMRFDPEAEAGDIDLVMQTQGSLDVAAENIRMKSEHEMVMMAEGATKELDVSSIDSDAGFNFEFGDWSAEETLGEGRAKAGDGGITREDFLRYNRDDPGVQALEESIRSRKSTKAQQ